ncbi:dUTP diphosphatase [Empedobacter stercoris]|uniref:dUTP diphosphatase n=1 Tax=Empedobacter stercoris TaxID=1628248 RepID=UPI001CE117CE|nr:hypothetical protein [Empedobacter stercoris]MCA4782333.1 dUTP diphosphatase [Empedobacter stercoris]
MKVKIKKLHKDAVIPTYAKDGDAGMDLTATSKSYDEHGNVVYGTGLAFEIPKGFVGLLFPRSSNAEKDLLLSNSVGVLDSGCRGEVMFKFKKQINNEKSVLNTIIAVQNMAEIKDDFKQLGLLNEDDIENFTEYQLGERIGQIIILPYPQIEFEEVEELSDSERGKGGYGSTGK